MTEGGIDPEHARLERENAALAEELRTLHAVLDSRASDEPAIAALRQSEARYRSVVTSATEGIVLQQANGVILTCNASAERILGLTQDQMMGRTSLDPRWRAIHEDGSPFPGDTHPALVTLQTGRPCRDVVMGVHKPTGELTWISINTEPIFGADLRLPEHVVCSFSDITAFRDAARALRESEEQLRLALSAARMGTWHWDIETNRLIWSETAERIFGFEPGHFTGTLDAYRATLHPEDRASVESAIRRSLVSPETGDAFYIEHRIVHPSSEVRWVESHGRVFRDGSGRAVRMSGTVVDVSLQKRLQEKLLHSQKMETVGRLAGGIAHDFNNLLTVILNAAHLALHEEPTPGTVEYLDLIRSAGERAARVTQQLLAFSKRQVVDVRPVHVTRLVSELGTLLHRLVGEHIETRTELTPEPWLVRADSGQLEQVLVNLAVNARDAMPSGGTLLIRTRNRTALESGAFGEHVEIEVRDTGLGMVPSAVARAFEPFYTTKPEGTGLGLATSYGIIQEIGGQIELESTPGQGTVARIRLPRTHEATPPSRTEPPLVPARRGTETVLAVEDDPLVRRLINRLLRDAGYQVLIARGGAEALELSRAHVGSIDLLLTDVVMPQMSGVDLAAQISAERPETKVLFVSGYTRGALAPYGFEEKRNAFLAKPYMPSALTEKIRSLLA